MALSIPRGSTLLPVKIQPLARHIRPIIIRLCAILARDKGHRRLAELCINMVPLPVPRRVVEVVVVPDGERLSRLDNMAGDTLYGRRVRCLSLEASQNVNRDFAHEGFIHWA